MYHHTEYRCNGCRARWETVDCDPWPAIRHHVETCNATVGAITYDSDRLAGVTREYISNRQVHGPESWAIA